MRLLRHSFPDRPAFDIALSNALLARVARGELGPTVRLYRPGPTLAFGRLDTLRAGFAEAGHAARDAGFEPIVRLAGGHAAAYHELSLIYEEITQESDATASLHDRFRDGAAILADALDCFGVDALTVRGRDRALDAAEVDERTLELARELEARHRWPIDA